MSDRLEDKIDKQNTLIRLLAANQRAIDEAGKEIPMESGGYAEWLVKFNAQTVTLQKLREENFQLMSATYDSLTEIVHYTMNIKE